MYSKETKAQKLISRTTTSDDKILITPIDLMPTLILLSKETAPSLA